PPRFAAPVQVAASWATRSRRPVALPSSARDKDDLPFRSEAVDPALPARRRRHAAQRPGALCRGPPESVRAAAAPDPETARRTRVPAPVRPRPALPAGGPPARGPRRLREGRPARPKGPRRLPRRHPAAARPGAGGRGDRDHTQGPRAGPRRLRDLV